MKRICVAGMDSGSDSGINGKEDQHILTVEEKRIAELGKPRLGQHPSIEILIEESYEFKVSNTNLTKPDLPHN